MSEPSAARYAADGQRLEVAAGELSGRRALGPDREQLGRGIEATDDSPALCGEPSRQAGAAPDVEQFGAVTNRKPLEHGVVHRPNLGLHLAPLARAHAPTARSERPPSHPRLMNLT